MVIKRLNHKAMLYIPLEYGDGNSIPKYIWKNTLHKSLDRLIDLGGGATVIDSYGYWKKNNRVNGMKTKVIIVYGNNLEEMKMVLEGVSNMVKDETKSETICYELDGVLYFV